MRKTDEVIKMKVSPDKMRAVADYFTSPKGGLVLMVEDVMEKLAAMNITYGIKRKNIEKICHSNRPLMNIIVAEGLKPKIGEKARIEAIIKLERDKKAQLRSDGSVDYHDLGEICSAKVDQELYRKIPPNSGTPGYDVFGKEIPGPLGRDFELIPGKGTSLDEKDPNLVRSTVEGEVMIQRGVIMVSGIHKIDGDVDFSTGNINFNGSIIINGTVKTGFKVSAEGNIEISGNVEDAVIEGGNDVIIHGGFTGTGEGVIKAKQDVMVKFVENQRIEADRDITINGEVYHATLCAGRSIYARGRKGIIVGGSSEAAFSIEAMNFGSTAGTPTLISIGIDPQVAHKMKALEDEIEKMLKSQKKIRQNLVLLYRMKIDNNNTLPPDKVELLEKLEKAKKSIQKTIESLEKEYEKTEEIKTEFEKVYAIASKKVFPKVTVSFGRQWISVAEYYGPSLYKMLGSDIIRIEP